MKHPDKISIVLPAYNGSKYIRESIVSCLNQTHKNIELIVVDDCSLDETPDIVKSFGDARITLIQQERNQGLPHALNTGFAHARGDYLTWTSDDNYFAETALEKMASFLKATDCCFVYCDYYMFDDGNPAELKIMQLPDAHTLTKQNTIGPCFFYSRRVKEAQETMTRIRVWQRIMITGCGLQRNLTWFIFLNHFTSTGFMQHR